MTDEQIIRTLAEFMGYERVRELMPGTRFSEWIGAKVGRQFDSEDVTLPDWLTSYDAIAEVWRRMRETKHVVPEHELGGVKWPARETTLAGIVRGTVVPTVQLFNRWYIVTPRQHAEALAAAFLEVKGKQQ